MVTHITVGHLYYFPTYHGGAIAVAYNDGKLNGDTCMVVIWTAGEGGSAYIGACWMLDSEMARQGVEIEIDAEDLVASIGAGTEVEAF